ncbi:MAG: 2OG-Fe(II) oxygenase [Proteobacteria bacterium]|nr:2OG-Fe(II) oxygenase [Pseudomonadota bacterium]
MNRLAAAEVHEAPYCHWILNDVLPAELAAELDALPFEAPALDGVSGSREIHNNTRTYVDAAAIASHPSCKALAEAFQHPDTVAAVEEITGADLDGCCLRIEYAMDTDGFWLQPHTDLGVKKFTLLYYLGPEGQPDLGTDVYADAKTWSHRAPFLPGGAMAFVPSDDTWHGFEPRPIPVVRKTLIVNYVTEEWRAREQLAYPDTPVSGRHGG